MAKDALQTIVTEDRDALVDAQRKVNKIKAKKAQELQDRLDSIMAEIKSLQDQKHELVRTPVQKKEFLKIVKDRLEEERAAALEEILLDHLGQSQKQNIPPLQASGIKLTVMAEKNLWRLFFLGLTEKDLKALVGKLPDIGISANDREIQLAEIDSRIAELSLAIEEEFGSPGKEIA